MNGSARFEEHSPFIALTDAGDHQAEIFAFPHAGGSPFTFRDLGNNLGAEIRLSAAKLPGRESRWRESMPTHIEEIVEPVASWIENRGHRPFVLLGASFGAHVALNVARRLEGLDRLKALVVLSARPPHLRSDRTPMRNLSDELLMERLIAMGGLKEEVANNKELMDFALPAIRADISIYETYVPEMSPIGCPIVAAGGVDDATVPMNMLSEWKSVTTSSLSVCILPGGHFILDQANEPLCRAIKETLMLP